MSLKDKARRAVEGQRSRMIVEVLIDGEREKVLLTEMDFQDNEDVHALFEDARKEVGELSDEGREDEASEAFSELVVMILVLSAKDPETEEHLWEWEDWEDLAESPASWVGQLALKALPVNGIDIESVKKTQANKGDKEEEDNPAEKKPPRSERKRRSKGSRARRKAGKENPSQAPSASS